jgi:hypothetical protein
MNPLYESPFGSIINSLPGLLFGRDGSVYPESSIHFIPSFFESFYGITLHLFMVFPGVARVQIVPFDGAGKISIIIGLLLWERLYNFPAQLL